jgi:hypothetical protein
LTVSEMWTGPVDRVAVLYKGWLPDLEGCMSFRWVSETNSWVFRGKDTMHTQLALKVQKKINDNGYISQWFENLSKGNMAALVWFCQL